MPFQSTPSVGRATITDDSDGSWYAPFQSTPSVGRATLLFFQYAEIPTFQSTPSVGRATRRESSSRQEYLFQSTPSVGRATRPDLSPVLAANIFQSTPSVGRATRYSAAVRYRHSISIHALRGEGDCKNIQICNAMLVHSAYKTVYFCDSCAFYLT